MGETRALLEQNIQHWNAHDSAAWVGDFSREATLVGPGAAGSGPETARMFYSIWQDAFPDNEVRVINIFADGVTAILQAEFEGTHTGTMNAPDQTIPATGRRVNLPFVTINAFDGEELTKFALYFDRAELLGQLGLLPAPAPA
jgi:predicted ester cyclase